MSQGNEIKLTKKGLATAPYGAGWLNVSDTQIKGLKLYSGKQKKTVYLRRRLNGAGRDFKVCVWGEELSPEQIRKKASKLASDIADGHDPAKTRKQVVTEGVTLGQAFERYIETRQKGKKPIKASTVEQYRYSFKTDLEPWKDRKLTDITGDDVEVLHEKRSKTSPSRANVAVRLLGRIYRLAMEVYKDAGGRQLVTYNPSDRVSTLNLHNEIPRRIGYISDDQLKAWFRAVLDLEPRRGGDAVSDLLIFTLMTGLRRNEAARLTWDRVDLDSKTFTIVENKASRPVILPLSDYLHKMLTKRHKSAGTRRYVFPAGANSSYLADWRHWCRKVTEESGVSFIPHDLRRTFATKAESLDISPYTIKALVNHSLPRDDVTGGYIQIDVERLRDPMQRITDHILTKAGIQND